MPTAHSLYGRLAALVAAAFLHCAQAGTFTVTPVRIHMAERDRATAVSIFNESDQAVVLQADFFRWDQRSNGEDVLTETDDLILSPPILQIAPNSKQVVRLARVAPPDGQRETTYRLVVREVPEALAPSNRPTLRVALAFSLPVFVTPPSARRDLRCEGSRGAADAVRVACTNAGTAYAQLLQLKLKRGDAVVAAHTPNGYVLPGATRQFDLRSASGPMLPGAVRLLVKFDDGSDQSFDLHIGE